VKWLDIVGLVFDFAGAIIIALGVIPSRRQFDAPATAADRVKQSNLARSRRPRPRHYRISRADHRRLAQVIAAIYARKTTEQNGAGERSPR
jgi:hypothetical protein